MRKILAGVALVALIVAPSLAVAQWNPFPLNPAGTFVFQSAASALGNGNVMTTAQMSTVTVQAVATSGTTTVTLEASLDGTNWTAMLACTPIGTASNASTISVTSTPKISRCVTNGIQQMRVRISTCTSCVGVQVTGYGSSANLPFND